MDLKVIDELCESMKNIIQSVNSNRLKTPGTMNIAEIMNRHHLENQHSNVLRFLLDPKEKHHHEEFGKQFLQLLKRKGLKINGEEIISIEREKSTDEARRMDLFITTESDFIILENKISAPDQQDQLEAYLSFAERHAESAYTVFIAYLTLFGNEPSENSILKEKLAFLKQQNRFVTLSYSKDILEWLNLKTKKREVVLQSGLIQYKDVVKAIVNQREENFNMYQELSKELANKYKISSRKELKEKMIALYEFQKHINLTLFINFFKDVFQDAKNKLSLFCNNKFDYKSIDEWESDVIKFQEKFGVRCCQNNITLDLFVQDLKSNQFIFACIESEIGDYGKSIVVDGYTSAVEPTSWFVNAILNIEDWEKRCNSKLSSHVVKTWFNIK